MDVQTIAMEAEDAAQALREYRQALKERPVQTRDAAERELAEIDAAVMRGYRELARGRRLVELSKVLAAGGTTDVAWTWRSWGANPRVEQRITTMPTLAVCRADSRFVFCRGIDANGVAAFHAGGSQRKADTVESGPTFDAPPAEQRRRWEAFRTMLPTIPPQLRPPKRLGLYHVLWEVEEWQLATPPGDPALLKHLGGDLYALLAVWDLTELERAVLAGVRG